MVWGIEMQQHSCEAAEDPIRHLHIQGGIANTLQFEQQTSSTSNAPGSVET
jgi:hypothetical protein